METIWAGEVKQRLQEMDWELIKGSTVLSVGQMLARVSGFVFSFVLAGIFSPQDYGAVSYGLALASIVAIVTQPFGQHVIARFIGRNKDDSRQRDLFLTNAWLILGALFAGTILIAWPILRLISELSIGILVVFVGTTLFYTYWGISSGFLAPYRLIAAHLSSNIIQIGLTILLIYWLRIESPVLALVIYGTSYFLPLALLQRFVPFPIKLNLSLLRRETISELLRFSWPLWITQMAYVLRSSVLILLLEWYVGTAPIGVYSINNKLALIFLFVPMGISTLLMPKTAALPAHAHQRLLKRMLAASLIVNVFILVGYVTLGEWFIRSAIGPEYAIGTAISVIIALRNIVTGLGNIIMAVLIGSGQLDIQLGMRVVTLVIAASMGWLLIPRYELFGAAIAGLAGSLGALIIYGLVIWRKKRRTDVPLIMGSTLD